MEFDIVVKNGTIVTRSATYKADIGIKGDRISAIGEDLSGKKVIDATDKLVTPGALDTHVHLEMPIGKYTSTDDFYTGTKAAAVGGTTTFIDFVEPKPEQNMVSALGDRKALADNKSIIDFGFHMTIGPNEIGKLDQVESAYQAGCRSFKIYMAYGLKLNDGEILQAIEAIGEAGGLPVVHAENWDVIQTLIDKNIKAGNTSPHFHPRSRPAIMEAEATGRVVDIATYLGVPVHIFHVSCPEAAERIIDARMKGLPVTGETCPQYLFLTHDEYDKDGVKGALPVCSPPIRGKDAQDGLWEMIARDGLHTISTDHCPFTCAEKKTGLGSFNTIPGGVPSIEMRFPAMYSKGVRDGLISLNQWVDLCCAAPAELFGLEKKGDIQVGKDADIVIFDPERKFKVTAENLEECADWTPYEGLEITGWPEMTISRGEIIAEDGKVVCDKGRGKFLFD